MDPIKMTQVQWNGLVALMRAIAVEAARHGKDDFWDAKRQAGACEAQVRQLFVSDD